MPVFAYTFKDGAGSLQKGTAEAETEDLLRARFQEQGFQITEITQLKQKGQKKKNYGKVKLTNLSVFCRQFSTMVDAGVSLVRCLDVLSRQTQDPKLKRILLDLGDKVESGESLSRAMQRHPRTFTQLFIGLIKAGEIGGVLEESLQRLSQFLEGDVALRRKVKAALTYPVLVMIAATGIVIFLVAWVVPNFAKLFVDLGMKKDDFPGPTAFLINISETFTQRWWMYLLTIFVTITAYRLFRSTHAGLRITDRLKMKMPIFGKLHHKICMARFARTMGTLLTSGVQILQAMETVSGVVGNSVMSDAIMEARARIREGGTISEPLEASKLFPPMVVHMIGVGEESGSLDYMLQKIADFYEAEVESTLASLTAAIEPLLIVFLGVIVGFIVVAMMLPLVHVVETLASGQGDS